MWEKMSFETYLGILLLAGVLLLASGAFTGEEHTAVSAEAQKITVVIDAGHGACRQRKILSAYDSSNISKDS